MKKELQLIILIAALIAGGVAQAEAKRPNILFILADDLGYGDVGFCPLPATNVLAKLKTSRLDALARGGVVLTGHYAAAPVSAPSRASLITGRVQGECSLRDNCFDREHARLRAQGRRLRDMGRRQVGRRQRRSARDTSRASSACASTNDWRSSERRATLRRSEAPQVRSRLPPSRRCSGRSRTEACAPCG